MRDVAAVNMTEVWGQVHHHGMLRDYHRKELRVTTTRRECVRWSAEGPIGYPT